MKPIEKIVLSHKKTLLSSYRSDLINFMFLLFSCYLIFKEGKFWFFKFPELNQPFIVHEYQTHVIFGILCLSVVILTVILVIKTADLKIDGNKLIYNTWFRQYDIDSGKLESFRSFNLFLVDPFRFYRYTMVTFEYEGRKKKLWVLNKTRYTDKKELSDHLTDLKVFLIKKEAVVQ